MTVKAVEWALRQTGVSSTAKLVLVMLADCINQQDEFAYPSQARIATVVNRKERQVRNHITALTAAGLIRCEAGGGSGRGKGRESTRYYLACDHRTGADKALTAGNSLPPAKPVTAGKKSPAAIVTGGNPAPLQPAISGNPSLYGTGKEPESLFGGDVELSPVEPPVAKAKPKAKRYTPEFEAFWKSWPATWRERSDKGLAFKRWTADVAQWSVAKILAARDHYLASPSVRKDGYRYAGRADVFLNGKLEAAIEAAEEAGQAGPKERWNAELREWVRT